MIRNETLTATDVLSFPTTAEWTVRTIFGSEKFSVEAISNSISIGGLALLLPLLIPTPYTEKLSPSVQKLLSEKGAVAYRKGDQVLATSAWLFFVILTLVWIYLLSRHANSIEFTMPELGVAFSLPAFISGFTYIIGIVHTEAKEKI